MANQTVLAGRDGLNTIMAANSTRDSLIDTALAFLSDTDAGLMELKLLSSAMGIIFLGAHAALRRPPSAKAPETRRERRRDEAEAAARSMELSDAILLPVMAGAVLVGMYKLIQWLQDPAILNEIMKWYISAASVVSLATMYAHGLEVAASLVFPRYWRREGDGSLWKVDQKTRTVSRCHEGGKPLEQPEQPEQTQTQTQTQPQSVTPLPGRLALLTPSTRMRKAAWGLRDLLTKEWALKIYLHNMGQDTTKIKFTHMTSLFMAVATTLVYFTTGWPFLSNMLGYGLAYTSFQVLSPTDFLTGSLVLFSLFLYDIFMVFYTPYMLTVATNLDVPIKLTFEAAERKSMLGLGDIVVPGMLIGWALRLDLWIHYANKIKREPVQLKIRDKDAASGQVVERSETKHIEVKAPYVNAKGSWGERLWTCRGVASFWWRAQDFPADVAATHFPKTYFYASMGGYALGMLVTLLAVLVSGKGQPALLYLVPGVLLSVLATSVVRGEFGKLWAYTENGSLDTADVVVDLDENGDVIKTVGKLENGTVDLTKDNKDDGKDKDKDGKNKKEAKEAKEGKEGEEGEEEKRTDEAKDEERQREKAHAKKHCVFSISLEAPSDDEHDD